MYRFKIGQELYQHEVNDTVTVIKTYPCKPNNEPVYLVRHNNTGSEYNLRETHLYTNKEIFPNARFRLDETVYWQSEKRGVKTIKYKIIKIYFDEKEKDIFYNCEDEKGNKKLFLGHQLYNYPFSIVPR